MVLMMLAQTSDPLAYFFDGKYGQAEVGGRFAGAEFHHSRPLPSRISFYYPVANSIDLSTDYWKRDESLPMLVGVKVNSGIKRWLGKEPWAYTLSPHKVNFTENENGLQYSMSYEFCFNEPAMVFTLKIKNISITPDTVSLYTHLKLALRTCQTYARKDSAYTEYDESTKTAFAYFDVPETQYATCFVQNVGAIPLQWTTSSDELFASDTGSSDWLVSSANLQQRTFPSPSKGIPVAAFVYGGILHPDDSIEIIQVIGSCRKAEVREKLNHLTTAWQSEIAAYDNFVRRKATVAASFVTGDEWLDRSSAWARAILATNAHYIDGSIVPMPCPAEYNFFFTHDVLMTNLAAVNFDLTRVKENLLYIASLAKDEIIPHAYYWRDDGFKTEYCTPDNWNHLWFILLSASYLRHSMDDSTAAILYPLVTKSLTEILQQKKGDNLMYAFRPDWWDIGHIEGPRAYITILTIRALREYAFMTSTLKKDFHQLVNYETLADSMQAALQRDLWDDHVNYLMNWNGNRKDTHFYMGSLLAPSFGVLNDAKSDALVKTATKELLDSQIGIRTVTPADFQTAEAISFFKFAGDEAGQPYYYINGGVWPHDNAWYAIALKNVGKTDEAVRFVKNVMTLDGVARSPMGIPAMYEYRFADTTSKEFGKIDKPSFLWAGGFYLYTLYQLYGIKENEWNVSFAGPLPSSSESVHYSFAFGKGKDVTVSGKGKYLQACVIDGENIPSLVLPSSIQMASKINVRFGSVQLPYLQNVNSMLHAAGYNEKKKALTIQLSSFLNHHTVATIVSPSRPRSTSVDGKKLTSVHTTEISRGAYEVEVRFTSSNTTQTLEIKF